MSVMRRTAMPGVLAAVLAIAAAGCGSSDDASTTAAKTTAATAAASAKAKDLKVGLVVDEPINDRGFNQSAYDGLKRAGGELGVQTRVLVSKTAADQVPNIAALAQQGYDLVVVTGFNYADPLSTVAKRFPKTNFAIIDYSQAALKGKPANVEGLLFKMEQGGYLAGYIAGSVQTGDVPRTNGKHVVGTIGGVRLPTVDQYIAGFRAGVKAADPKVTLLNGYTQTFTDSGACKQLALNQIAQGADTIFPVAGNCNLGTIDAAKEKGIWAVGGDTDQSYLGPQIITSAMKRVDVAVFNAAKQAAEGQFKAGTDYTFDVNNGGIGLGKISPDVPKAVVDKIDAVVAEMEAGKLQIPTSLK
jgi:basic membrane protein A and related proteins